MICCTAYRPGIWKLEKEVIEWRWSIWEIYVMWQLIIRSRMRDNLDMWKSHMNDDRFTRKEFE